MNSSEAIDRFCFHAPEKIRRHKRSREVMERCILCWDESLAVEPDDGYAELKRRVMASYGLLDVVLLAILSGVIQFCVKKLLEWWFSGDDIEANEHQLVGWQSELRTQRAAWRT